MNFCPECAAPVQEESIDNVPRLVCSSANCSYTFWNNPTPVATGLIRLGDDYILAQNTTWKEGMYSLISGFVEKGETPEETIVRELKEELGLTCDKLEFIGHFKFELMNQLMIAYHIEASGEVFLNDEIASIKTIHHAKLCHFDFGELVLSKQIVLKWLRHNK
jgi:NADH pyrophosphatase NudC (nudix superfamily)